MKGTIIVLIAFFVLSTVFMGVASAKTQEQAKAVWALPILGNFLNAAFDDMPETPYRYPLPVPVCDQVVQPPLQDPVKVTDDFPVGPMRYFMPERVMK